jgi:ATP-dependent helicase HrpB
VLSPLPIDTTIPALVESLAICPNAVVIAPPGAGKTTRVPPALARASFLEKSNSIVMLQPRRVAARAAASRIASEQNWRLGYEVGYQIRFENRTRPDTLVRVMTEGILTRRIQSDPLLEGIGCVILDEFHERSIHTDLALALLREIQNSVREDLRIVVMSATLDPGPVAEFLGNAPVLQSKGRLHPVEVEYVDAPPTMPIWEQAATQTRHVVQNTDGHILVFFPGIGEIRRAQNLLQGIDADVHILHSSVSSEDQDRALQPCTRRKIILATNIAETSLTIDGVRTVIDTGLARVLVSDTRLGIDRLELRRISRASAAQRTGRAGRTAPGRCIRLWSHQQEGILEERDTPEIHRVDLAGTLLALHDYGIADPRQFGWFEAPRPNALEYAERLLEMLGALDARHALTDLGRKLSGFPLHPRLARLLIAGREMGLPREAATIAALLSERDALDSPTARRQHAAWEGESDVLERLEALEAGRSDNQYAVHRLRDTLLKLIGPTTGDTSPGDHSAALRRVLLCAYPDRVTLRRPNDPTRGVMVGGRGIVLEPSSVVRKAPLFLSIDPRDAPPLPHQKNAPQESRVSLASAIEEDWLPEMFPHLYTVRDACRFDAEKEKVLSVRQTTFCGLLLHEEITGRRGSSEAVAKALFDYLRRDLISFFERNASATEWLARVRFLRFRMPELDLPAFETDVLEQTLRAACEGCTSVAQTRERNLIPLLEQNITWKQKAALDEHAPHALKVPSGNNIRLTYPTDGEGLPILAVRLQELFGLPETPRIAGGRVPVLLHLLAPNYRPTQITTDLKSFWNGAYQEVRKELRARYPKHPWPDDPWNAPPISVGRRRNS